MKEQNIDVSSL